MNEVMNVFNQNANTKPAAKPAGHKGAASKIYNIQCS